MDERDHLARLCFDGGASSGHYTFHTFNLRLQGADLAVDHIVYLHEIHHATLNDVTAWGTALHVYARVPSTGADQFGPLLNACRTVHESLATFASVQIAAARHGSLDAVLATYPRYVSLYRSTMRMTAGVTGANRRQQMASALARLCMQTTVLDEITAAGLDGFRLASIREIDRPDARWSWFLRRGPEMMTSAAAAADRAVTDRYGPAAIGSDDDDLASALDSANDEAWDYWEATAYDQLRAALAKAGARVLPINGHQQPTADLLALVHERYGDLGLRPAMPEDVRRDDAAVAAAILEQVRHDLSGERPHAAALAPPMIAAALVDLLGRLPVVEDQPAMIVHVRPVDRMAALYRWPGGRLPDELRHADEPVAAVRLIGAGDDPTIGHVIVSGPDQLNSLATEWGERGPFVLCAAASCLADPDFARRWFADAHPGRPVFVLIDVEPARFVPRWQREQRTIVTVAVEMADTGGTRHALLIAPGDGRSWWIVLADDVTVRLVVEYLRAWLGPLLREDATRFDAIRTAATAAITDLLATESFTSFDALGASVTEPA